MQLYQPTITGSLSISGSIVLEGPITVISGSVSGTASLAVTSSYSQNSERLDNLDSTSFVFTSSYNVDSSSFSGRVTNNELTGSSLTTASGSFSSRVTTIESKYATTGSNIFTSNQTICGNLTTTGTITAQTINVQQVTSSVVYSCGSNIFGCALTDTQQFTGSMFITGSNIRANVTNVCFSGRLCTETQIVNRCLSVGAAQDPNDVLTVYGTTNTGINICASDQPRLGFFVGGGSADNKIWDFIPQSNNTLIGRIVNDAKTIASTWLNVTRNTTTITSICFPQTNPIFICGCVGIGIVPNGPGLRLGDNTVLRVEGASSGEVSPDNFGISIGGRGSFRIDCPGVGAGRFVVNNAGCVGINNNSPTYLLDVNGNGRFCGNVVFNRASTSAGNNIEFRTGATLNWYIGTRGLTNNNFYIVNEGLSGLSNFILDATSGAATFACRVSAGGSMLLGEVQSSYSLVETTAGNGIWLRPAGVSSPLGLFVSTGGNVGIGCTVSPWAASYRGLNIGSGAGIMASGTNYDMYLMSNVYYDGSWKVTSSASVKPTMLRISDGFSFNIGSTNSIGSNSTFTELAAITNDGRSWFKCQLRVGIDGVASNFVLDTNIGTACTISGVPGTAGGGCMSGIRVYNDASGTSNSMSGVWFSTGPHWAGIASGRCDVNAGWGTDLRFYVHYQTTDTLDKTYEKMRLNPEGVLTLFGYGAGTLSTNSAGVISASDGRLKTKTRTIENGLCAVMQLEPTYYRWNEGTAFHTEYEELGFIAQEVACVIPEASPEPEDEHKLKNYSDRAIIAMLTKGMQEQQYTINILKSCLGLT